MPWSRSVPSSSSTAVDGRWRHSSPPPASPSASPSTKLLSLSPAFRAFRRSHDGPVRRPRSLAASSKSLTTSPRLLPPPTLGDAEIPPMHPLYTSPPVQPLHMTTSLTSASVSISHEPFNSPRMFESDTSQQRTLVDAPYSASDDSYHAGSSRSRTSSLFGAFKERLHLRSSNSAQGHGEGAFSQFRARSHSRSQSVTNSPSVGFAGLGSRLSVNSADSPHGDFANFLAAAELKERLKQEQNLAIKRAIKSAKHPHKKGKKRSSRPNTADEDIEVLESPSLHQVATLEERGYFPGDLRHHGRLDAPPRKSSSRPTSQPSSRPTSRLASLHSSQPSSRPTSQPASRPTSRPTSSHSTSALRRLSSSSFGSVHFSLFGKPCSETGAESPSQPTWLQTLDAKENDDIDLTRNDQFARRVSSSDSDESSTSSINFDALPKPSASTLSLLSYTDDAAALSLHSGEAAQALAKPLLELEELELDAFLKNFGRHTREVQVAQQPTLRASSRMPKWDDFRVANDEAKVAEREGRRVTVLTHVDHGLQRIAAEGQVVAVPRPPKEHHLRRSSSKLSLKSKGKKKSQEEVRVGEASSCSSHDERAVAMIRPGFARASESGSRGHIEYDSSADTAFACGDSDGWEIIDDAVPDNEVLVQQDVLPAAEQHVDGVAFCIAYILALVERYAPEELDSSPHQAYRESKARSHIERLYLIAPFWENFASSVCKLYRWEDPEWTGFAAMIYFTLWHTNMIPASCFLVLIYYTLQFRYFPPEASVLHERIRKRMSRGMAADRVAERLRRRSRLDILELYKRWVEKYGKASQLATGDLADFHEKVKNLILWRNPTATWRTLSILLCAMFSAAFLPARWINKLFWAFVGITFFCLFPLQSHYPRYRRPLSPVWWALWGSPTDAQFAVQLLRRRLEQDLNTSLSATSDDVVEAKCRSMLGVFASNKRPAQAAADVTLPNEGDNLLSLAQHLRDVSGKATCRPRKLRSFFCQHNAVPGHLYVTSRMIYFVALHSVRPTRSRKSCQTPLDQITGLVKTKSIKLVLWSSAGLQIQRTGQSSLFFSNMSHRDAAFNLILAIGAEKTWSKV